ncbi:hypothetical protein [Atlantibacter hermannii]|uniref:hypothetical protein n=1 Tax=Atlantibacter hermannii TaxID=565 RepID=UPI0028983512|nr:hypothetical protein [Atlantibacter hermannii]
MEKRQLAKIVLLMTSVAMLQACDSMEDKVKKVLKCGLAVNELGNSTAKSNFNANRMTLFKGDAPHFSSAEIYRIDEEAREELGMDFPNHRENAKRLIEEYEEGYCVDLHKVPETSEIKTLMRIIDF